MARIRSVKPEFWTDGNMVRLSVTARLFYIGTWNFALCDRGHLPDDPLGLKLKILPADDVDAQALVEELLVAGRLMRRRSGGRTYLVIPRLSDHQKTETRWQSRCPHCASEEADGFTEDSPILPEPRPSSPEPADTPEASAEWGKGGEGRVLVREGKGVPLASLAGAASRAAPRDSATVAPIEANPPTDTAQTLVAEWIDHCRKRPPGAVIGQVGKHLAAMLAEGVDAADLRKGLAAWHDRGLHPSTLSSVVHEVMNSRNGARSKPSTTDERVSAGLALAAELDAEQPRELTA